MSYVICGYNYNDKSTSVLEFLSSAEVLPFIESYLYDYIAEMQGFPKNFQDLFFNHNNQPHISSLVNGRLFYIKKGNPENNFLKFTVMEKKITNGYLYNSVELVKHFSITFFKEHSFKHFVDYNDGPDCQDEFINGVAFDELMLDLLGYFEQRKNPKIF